MILPHTSIAFSAFVSWITPTVAFATRMRRITKGSTNAVAREVVPSESSRRASTNEINAEARSIRTSWSLNCSKISSIRGVDSPSGSSKKHRGTL